MSQRVPNCHIDETPAATVRSTKAADIPMLDYEVAELRWENGQVGLHSLGPPRVPAPSKYLRGAGGTLESIVDQATRFHNPYKPKHTDELVPWAGMDALVPEQQSQPTTRVRSCSLSIDTYGFTSASLDDNSSSGGKPCTNIDDHDSLSPQIEEEKEGGKSSASTKRSRAAAIHNHSERKRRDKINQRMKTLQKLVPNSSKTDKASMLDEVIEYLKQLQAQVSMMGGRMNMPSMILPMPMQQQLQLSLMGLGLGIGMPGLCLLDLNSMNPFVPGMTTSPSWDVSDTRFQSPLNPDPMAAFLACSPQPTTMDAYTRMAALYQQMQQQIPPSNPK